MNCHSKKRTAEDINSINVALAVDNQDNRNEATEQHILKTRCANQTVSPLALLKNPSYRDKDTANSLFNTPTTKALSLDKKLASEKLSTEDTPIYDSLAFLESRLCPKSSSKRYHRKRGKISGETQKKRISSPDFRNCKHIGTFFSAICKKESILQKVEAKLQQYEAKKLKIENDLKYMKTKFKESKYSQRLSDYDNSHYPDMIPSESRVQDIGAADSGIEIDTENLLASLNSSYLPPTFQALGVIQKHRHTKRLRSLQKEERLQHISFMRNFLMRKYRHETFQGEETNQELEEDVDQYGDVIHENLNEGNRSKCLKVAANLNTSEAVSQLFESHLGNDSVCVRNYCMKCPGCLQRDCGACASCLVSKDEHTSSPRPICARRICGTMRAPSLRPKSFWRTTRLSAASTAS